MGVKGEQGEMGLGELGEGDGSGHKVMASEGTHSAGGWSGSWRWAGGTSLGGTMEGSPQRPCATPQPLPLCPLLQPWRCPVLWWLPWPPRRPRASCCCCRSKHWLRRRRPKPSRICSLASCRSGTSLQPPPVASKFHPAKPPNHLSPENAPLIPTRAGATPVLLHPWFQRQPQSSLLPLSHLPRPLHRSSCPMRSRAACGVSTGSARFGAQSSARPRTKSCARTSRSSVRPSHGSWTARMASLRWLRGWQGWGGGRGHA